ncbi:MAG: hypothetical protein AAGK02_16040 [Pseudomonadota bacterium]
MKPYWTSIYLPSRLMPSFEYHGPWWVSGQTGLEEDDAEHIIVAWVMATDEDAAYETLRLAVDEGSRPPSIKERFAEERPSPDRSNPSGRFELADWMQWPWPIKPLQPRPEQEQNV